MKTFHLAAVVLVCVSTSACNGLPTKNPEERLNAVSDVLNSVKDELNAYVATPTTVLPKKGKCHDGSTVIDLVPTKITLTLKTAVAQQNEPSAGLTVPIGIVSFDPSYSGSYSQARTQTLQVPLIIDMSQKPRSISPGNHPIANAISQFRDELLKSDHDKTPCYTSSEEMTLTMAFDVVNTSTGGFTLKLVPFKLGDKETLSNESHQSLEMKFKLSGAGGGEGGKFLLY